MEFERYVERREGCEAIRYSSPDQAHWIATQLFHSQNFSVVGDLLSIGDVSPHICGPRDVNNNLLIKRGDFIVRDHLYRVVDRSEFVRKFERPDYA